MIEKLDQFARELVEKTHAKKLNWRRMTDLDSDVEGFTVDLDQNFSFQLRSVVGVGPNHNSDTYHTIALQLWKDHLPMRESVVRNWQSTNTSENMQEMATRFRLYSDLLDVVREGVYDSEGTFVKVEELLRKIS